MDWLSRSSWREGQGPGLCDPRKGGPENVATWSRGSPRITGAPQPWQRHEEKTPMLEGVGGRRRRGRQRMRCLDGITDLMDVSLSKLRELVVDREAWHVTIHRVAKSRT